MARVPSEEQTVDGFGSTLPSGGALDFVYRDRGDPQQALSHYEQALAVRIAAGANPLDLADARFAVAKALVRAGGDEARARDLATQAAEDYATLPAEGSRVAAANAWLAERAD